MGKSTYRERGSMDDDEAALINEDVFRLTAGARTRAERIGYRYALLERNYRYRYLFDPLRIILQQEHISAYLSGENPFPRSIEIDPSNACNHSCAFCIYSSLHPQGRGERLPGTLMLDVISQTADLGSTSVLFVGGGEPLTNHATIDAIEAAHAAGLDVGLVTNGSLISPAVAARLRVAATYVRVSIDAADPVLHRRLHGRDDHSRVVNGLSRLTSARGPATVGVSFFANSLNVHDMKSTADLARDLGAEYFQVKTYSGLKIDAEFHSALLDVVESTLDLVSQEFEVHLADRILNPEPYQVRGYSMCHWQGMKTIVGADGNVFLCAQKRVDSGAVIGNVHESSLREIWEGKKRREVLQRLVIEDCPYCVHDPQNRIIEFLTSYSRPHGDFY